MNSPVTPYSANARISPQAALKDETGRGNTLWFSSADEMLDFCTRHWQENFITADLQRKEIIEEFSIRPFFLLVSVDGPLLTRFFRGARDRSAYLLTTFLKIRLLADF